MNVETLEGVGMGGKRIVDEVARPDGVVVAARFNAFEAVRDLPGLLTIELITRRDLGSRNVYEKVVPVYYSGDDVRLLGDGDVVAGARALVDAYLQSDITTVGQAWFGEQPLAQHMEALRSKNRQT